MPRERRRWWRGYGVRIDAFYLAVFACVLGSLVFAADRATEHVLTERDRRALLEEVDVRAEEFYRGGLAGLTRIDVRSRRTFVVRLSTPDDVTVHRSGPPDAPDDRALAFDASALDGSEPALSRVASVRERRWTIATARVSPRRVLQVGMSDAVREATLRELRRGYLWIVGGAALLALLGGVLVRRRAMRPLRDLARATQRVVDRGDFSVRVPQRGSGDALDGLAERFNTMLARNEQLVTGMREALDHVAHDLRTPLTRMRGSAEVALTSGDEVARREALADVVEETDAVLAMLRTLMDVGEAEAGVMKLERQRVDLSEIAREVADLYELVAEEAEVTLTLDLDDSAVAWADRVRMRQVVANLVDNAVKYSSSGGEVTIRTRRGGDLAEVEVRDRGIGVPPEALDRIWERLYRADPSRSERGLGLGLSLVRAVVEAHGGDATVTSERGRGSAFTIRLPATAAA